MKKITVYVWMSLTVVFSAVLFTGIYYLNLQSNVKQIVSTVDRNGPPVFTHSIYGDFNESLDKPMDVVKIGQFIYVTDTNNKRVQVFDQSGTAIFRFGTEGMGEGEFKFPYGIAGDKEENIYVADMYNGNISIFTNKGEFIKYFQEQGDENIINSPGGLRIFNEKLYVTDIKKNKVYIFNLEGEMQLEIGETGSQEGMFIAPNSVTIDKEENIYVTDSGNNRVQVFDKEGKFLRIVNGSEGGTGPSTFINPRGIGVDSRGILYVVNNLSHMVYGFDANGKQVFQFGGMGDANDQFYLPNGLFIDERDEIFITDTLNQRVTFYY